MDPQLICSLGRESGDVEAFTQVRRIIFRKLRVLKHSIPTYNEENMVRIEQRITTLLSIWMKIQQLDLNHGFAAWREFALAITGGHQDAERFLDCGQWS